MMDLYTLVGKNVRITTENGRVFEGTAYDYTPSQDNTPEIESISIDEYELYQTDIVSIEILE